MDADTVYTIVFWIGGLTLLGLWIALMERWRRSDVPTIDVALDRYIKRLSAGLNQLNGWARLWLLLSCVWSIVVGAGCYSQWNNIDGRYSRQIQSAKAPALPQTSRYSSIRRREPYEVRMRQARESRDTDREALLAASFWRWLLPVGGVYALAHALTWVSRGFGS